MYVILLAEFRQSTLLIRMGSAARFCDKELWRSEQKPGAQKGAIEMTRKNRRSGASVPNEKKGANG
jgi:hypothetical protein